MVAGALIYFWKYFVFIHRNPSGETKHQNQTALCDTILQANDIEKQDSNEYKNEAMSLLSSQPKNTKSGAGAALLHGTDIAKVLSSTGPVVKAVLLKHIRNDGRDGKPHHVPPRASSAISTAKVDQANSEPKAAPKSDETAQTDEQKTDQHSNKNEQNGNHQNPPHRVVLTELIEEVLVDTTPSKNAVKTILGGPFTFLGQYPDEGTIVMARRDLPILDSTDSDEEEDGDKNDGNQLMNADAKALYELSVKELKALCSEYYGDDMDTATIVEKSELVDAILQAQLPINPHQLQPLRQEKRDGEKKKFKKCKILDLHFPQ